MVLNNTKIRSKISKRAKKTIRRTRRRFRTSLNKVPEQVGLNKKVGVKL